MIKNQRSLKTIIICLSAVCLVLSSCGTKEDVMPDSEVLYFCDAEVQTKTEDGRLVFENGNIQFKSAETQSAEYAFNGDHSVKLDSIHKYGMSFILTDIQKGEFFEASVWQKETETPGALICSVTGNANFTLSSLENGFYEHKDGWMKHVLQFKAITDLDSATFFIFAGGDGEVAYFDDLQVIRHSSRSNMDWDASNSISIHLPDSSQATIDNYISKAIKEEIIRDKYKGYVSGNIIMDGDSIPIELRLKGDWTDHLISGNASYRIKTASGTAFRGLRSFSIQHPKTRNYMHEWFMHKLSDEQDLLSTRYSFLSVNLNEQYQGAYALEEHFDKQLLESRNRREGPILKMDETAFWALAVLAREQGLDRISAAYYEAATATCFKVSRTMKSDVLKGQFMNGAILLNHFKKGYQHPELIFDIERIATYYALMDLGNVHHSLAWHNRRFYYNPITTKLEHVGFDMIPMVKPYNLLIATSEFNKKLDQVSAEGGLNHYLFLNQDFREAYTRKLTEISNEAYLDSAFARLNSEIADNVALIGSELPGYSFDQTGYYEKAKLIRTELKTLDKRWDVFMSDQTKQQVDFEAKPNQYDLGDQPFYLEEIGVNAYRSEIDSLHYLIELENFHFATAEIIGYSVKPAKDSIIYLELPILLEGFKGGSFIDTSHLVLNEKPSRIFFKLNNIPEKVFKKKFIKWKKPQGEHPRVRLHNDFSRTSKYYKVAEQRVTFNAGNYQINELVYIPEGYEVQFNPETQIDFVENGGLILNGTTRMMGTDEAEIKFTSSDSTGMGITILQADSVIVRNVVIENMNTLDYEGWVLTGAFNIYESGVDIDGLTISGNNCEDGLNVIRSNFKIQNCLIEFTKSDGFDADFCTGVFSNSTFRNTGNDCIDFSGSTVTINDIEIFNSGDKGVSAGERSMLYLTNITIDGALTGLASKDDSHIRGKQILVKNAEVGLAAFQKKPEYGGSTIILNDSHYQHIKTLGLIEKESEVKVAKQTFRGYQKFDIDAMYARFEKK
ncbi:MAG: hypothetical protein GQ574_06600 [Crocinitomix sp.]|nr:hypothetical protein [Crocinitomix sp.]